MRDPDRRPDDIDARIEEALGPVEPPGGVRNRILATARPVTGRRLRGLAVPVLAYALGALTVHLLPRDVAPVAPPPSTGVSFDSIADQPPAPPDEPAPAPAEIPYESVLPRIS
jgi:hypothetical protein